MTIYEGYIGSLDDPDFRWAGGNWNGNIPERIGPMLPPLPGCGESIYHRIAGLVESGRLPGKQTEWGAYVAVVTRRQLLDLLHDWYGSGGCLLEGASLGHWSEDFHEVLRLVGQLEEGRPYALVGTEF